MKKKTKPKKKKPQTIIEIKNKGKTDFPVRRLKYYMKLLENDFVFKSGSTFILSGDER